MKTYEELEAKLAETEATYRDVLFDMSAQQIATSPDHLRLIQRRTHAVGRIKILRWAMGYDGDVSDYPGMKHWRDEEAKVGNTFEKETTF